MSETVKIPDCKVVRSTDKACLVLIDSKEHWIPQSVIDDDSEIWKEGDTGDLVIKAWFAKKENLDYE